MQGATCKSLRSFRFSRFKYDVLHFIFQWKTKKYTSILECVLFVLLIDSLTLPENVMPEDLL